MVPVTDEWIQFKIQVEDTGAQTEIRARFWTEGAPEPGIWQIDAIDTHVDRPRAGTIGVWAFGFGRKHWDDFAINPLPSP